MKKSSFVALILGTAGGVFFALGMCMVLLPEWGMETQGTVCGVIGLAILLAALLIWQKMEHKAPIKSSRKTLLTVFAGVLGALLLGVGMCMTMVSHQMVMGIVIGLAEIVMLLILIPLIRGVHG